MLCSFPAVVRRIAFLAAVLAAVPLGSAAGQTAGPAKYGAGTMPLSRSREYFRLRDAPDFWALMPYYQPQPDANSCSIACLAMLANAARVDRNLSSADELATPIGLVTLLNDPELFRALGPEGAGVTLEQLADLARRSLLAYGVEQAEIEVVYVDRVSTPALARLRDVLIANERSRQDILIANFLQSALTGDPEGAVGHMAPVGAYDEERRRVLILDPDRRYYEPYWVSDEKFLAGLGTRDQTSGRSRGYLRVRLAQ